MRHATILLALSIATTARADGDRTLHLAVHGSLDSAVVGAALARELGVDVAVVDSTGGTCELPCLDVAIDGKNTATIVFAPRSGPPRGRTVTLGPDTSQWALVVTLLAGNVVRDEAQDVLAGLPSRDLPRPPDTGAVPAAPGEQAGVMPPAAPGSGPVTHPEDAAPPTEAAREHSWLAIGFLPVLSTDLTHVGSVQHSLSFNVLVGASGGSSGLSLSGIADLQRGPVSGAQLAGVAALARRVSGTQIGGVAAISGDVSGLQVGGVAAVADRVAGVQIAGVASVAGSNADTQIGGVAAVSHGRTETQVAGVAAVTFGAARFQAGGVASVARGSVNSQVAGVAAVAAGDSNFQAGGVTSVAHGTANVQLAGVVNVAHRVRGLQLAPFNVAHEVDGVQVGVVNVGGSADGFSFGLINIVPGGRADLETSVDSNRTGTILFRHGSRRWHNVYGIGGHPVNTAGPNDDVWMYGLGFGPSLSFDDTLVDLEAIGWQVNHGPRHERDISILGQLRLSISHRFGPIAVVAGGILNSYITNDEQSPLILERTTSPAPMTDRGVTVTWWPSAFIGLRI